MRQSLNLISSRNFKKAIRTLALRSLHSQLKPQKLRSTIIKAWIHFIIFSLGLSIVMSLTLANRHLWSNRSSQNRFCRPTSHRCKLQMAISGLLVVSYPTNPSLTDCLNWLITFSLNKVEPWASQEVQLQSLFWMITSFWLQVELFQIASKLPRQSFMT